MIDYEKALSLVLLSAESMPVGRVRLEDTLGYVLARPLTASFDLPRFDHSAMDGYGIRVADLAGAGKHSPRSLPVARTIYAGNSLGGRLQKGTAVKLMTGAWLPLGVDAVVMQEYCRQKGDEVLIAYSPKPGENIRKRGEEFKKGALVLDAGTQLTPPAVGLLATFGNSSVEVYRKPAVSILTIGDELLTPGARCRGGMIYDSNTYTLAAALKGMGIAEISLNQLKDDRRKLRTSLEKELDNSDVILTVGGVSVGELDLVKEILSNLGVEQIFWKAAIKPGKPVMFGRYVPSKHAKKSGKPDPKQRAKLVFGLPGNPVAALLAFQQLVKPALHKMTGLKEPRMIILPARLAAPRNKKAGRLEWVRGVVRFKDGKIMVWPTGGQSSHMLGGLAEANCLIQLPASQTHFEEGQEVMVELLNWNE